jgi:steroid 5-alpha reductase family enzyme
MRREVVEMEQTQESGRWSRQASFIVIVGIYVVAVAVGILVAEWIGVDRAWWAVAGGYLASTAVLYVASQMVRNGSTFDAWWSVMPSAMAVWLLAAGDPLGDGGVVDVLRPVLVLLVLAWGVRLTANWALGWPGLHHEDWRYVQLYDQMPLPRWLTSLLTVHLFPTIAVAIASLPLALALTRDVDHSSWPLTNTLLAALGVVITAAAIAIEHVADVELRAFNRTKRPGDVLDTGWWARSRHPNYLGEMGFWWGTGVCAIAVDPSIWWALVGPLAITVMFLIASIPIIERRSAERRPGWDDYAHRTPMVLPRLRRT